MTAVTPELASFSLLPHLFVLSFCPFWSREQVCLKVSSQESFLYKAVNYSNKICDRSPQKFLLPFSDRRMDKLYSEAVALCIFVLFPQCFQNVFVHCACTEDFTSQCELQGQHVQDAISLSMMITFCIACTCSSLGGGSWLPALVLSPLKHGASAPGLVPLTPLSAQAEIMPGITQGTCRSLPHRQVRMGEEHGDPFSDTAPTAPHCWAQESRAVNCGLTVRWGNPSSCWAVTSSLCLLLPVLTFPALLRWNKQEGAYCQNTLKQTNEQKR